MLGAIRAVFIPIFQEGGHRMIQNAVASQTGTMVNALSAALENVGGGGDITIPVYLGGTLLDEVVVNAQTRQNLRSGGR